MNSTEIGYFASDINDNQNKAGGYAHLKQADHGLMTSPSIPSPARPPRSRLAYLDALRAAAICAVIVIHVSSSVAEDAKGLGWEFANFLKLGCKWAVPVFVMISGALLLDPSRTELPSQFYRRRLARLGAPFVFWSVFYLVWRRFFEHEQLSLFTALSEMAFGRPYYHLYFLFLIAGLYMITPLLRTFVRIESGDIQLGAAIIALLWTASAIVLAAIFRQHNNPLALAFFTWCVGYYLVGHVIAAGMLPTAWYRWGVAMFLGGLIVAVGATRGMHHFFKGSERFVIVFGGIVGPVTMIMSIGLFTAFANRARSRPEADHSLPAVINWISGASFGIYLFHPVLMSLLRHRHISFAWPSIWIGIPLWTTAILGASLAVTIGAKKIPGLRAVFG